MADGSKSVSTGGKKCEECVCGGGGGGADPSL